MTASRHAVTSLLQSQSIDSKRSSRNCSKSRPANGLEKEAVHQATLADLDPVNISVYLPGLNEVR